MWRALPAVLLLAALSEGFPAEASWSTDKFGTVFPVAAVVVIHAMLSMFVLNRIWMRRISLYDSVLRSCHRRWQLGWSLIALLTPVVGPIVFLALADMPAPHKMYKYDVGYRSGYASLGPFGRVGAEGIPFLYHLIDGTSLCHLDEGGLATCKDHAEHGDVDAQTFLGSLLLHGHEVHRNTEEAYFWLSVAENAQHATAHHLIVKLREKAASRLSHQRREAVDARVAAWKPREDIPEAKPS
jgi:hypothetical protein